MDDDVRELVLRPFQEIIEKGNEALENANDAGRDDMRKAAEKLVKEGEKALKKIEPVCKKRWEEFSTNFVAALQENDEIAKLRNALNEVLLDFDDFIEADDFDASEYTKLQLLSRKAVLPIYEILTRMKLEHPRIPFADFDSVAISRTTSLAGRSHASDAPPTPSDILQQTVEEVEEPEQASSPRMATTIMSAQAGPDQGWDAEARPAQQQQQQQQQQQAAPLPESPVLPHLRTADSVRPEEIPAEPLQDPWQTGSRFSIPDSIMENADLPPYTERRARVPSVEEEAAPPLTASPGQVSSPFNDAHPTPPRPRRLDQGVELMIREEGTRSISPGSSRTARIESPPTNNVQQWPNPYDGASDRPSREAQSPTHYADQTDSPQVQWTMTSSGPRQLQQRPQQASPSSGLVGSMARSAEPFASVPRRPVPAARNMLPSQTRGNRESLASDSTRSRDSSMFEPGARDSLVSPVTDPRASVHDAGSDVADPSPVKARDSYHDLRGGNSHHHYAHHLFRLPHVATEDQPPLMEEAAAWPPSPRPPPAAPRRTPEPPSPLVVTPPASHHAHHIRHAHNAPHEQAGLIPVTPAIIEEQAGLEVVDTGQNGRAAHVPPPPVVIREPNVTITVDSSFYQLKGFCDGAKDIIRGGIGVRKVKKGGIGAGNSTVAKCTNKACMFELEWKQVEADISKSEFLDSKSINYRNTATGIGFRLRFISKSHLVAKNISDHLYGCLFCIQLGRTTEESDATVFLNQRQLFAHLARHPRPLPAVPGLTVVETPEMPDEQHRNNYDLHFPSPPAVSLMAGLGREVSQRPAAVATEHFRRTALGGALRAPPPPDDGQQQQVLQFLAGQRIVGIEFPARFDGLWAVGWADNVWAAFPADVVRLEPPPPAEIGRGNGGGGNGSNLRAVARWKRHPKDKDPGGWLKFDKGEVITNISFPYPEHWCWHGCNSRGRYGIFPQSHMEPNTLCETPGGDRASVISQESKSGAAGMLAQFSSIRRRNTRPVSAAGSHSSGETATPLSAQTVTLLSAQAVGGLGVPVRRRAEGVQ